MEGMELISNALNYLYVGSTMDFQTCVKWILLKESPWTPNMSNVSSNDKVKSIMWDCSIGWQPQMSTRYIHFAASEFNGVHGLVWPS